MDVSPSLFMILATFFVLAIAVLVVGSVVLYRRRKRRE